MEMVLSDIVLSKCHVYLDDSLAFGRDFTIALANLIGVFDRPRSADLKLKPTQG
jgi:hypothetical protein